jgi:hypothetical protein
MLLSCHQNAGQNLDIKTGNRCFENVAMFKYFGTTITNENPIQEEIKRRLNSLNAWYHSVQNFCLLVCCLKTKILHYTKILPAVLCGFETWSLTLKEEHTLREIEKMMLRRIFGPKKNEVTGSWGKLHNEELHNLHSSPSVIRMVKSRRMILAGHVARLGEKRNAYRILVGNPEGKKPLGRPRLRCVGNIKQDLREIKWDGVDCFDPAQNRNKWRSVLNIVMILPVP